MGKEISTAAFSDPTVDVCHTRPVEFSAECFQLFSMSLIRSPDSSATKSASAGNTTELHFPRYSNGGGRVGSMSSANPEVKRTLAIYVLAEEFFNTISNIPCLLLALIGLINALRQRFEKRFSVLHVSNMVLAIGSILYHATLQRVQQQGDETPMVWEMLLYIYILYSPDWHYRSTMPTFLFLYGAAFAIAHALVRFQIGFKVHYAILCLLCIPRMYKYYIHTKDHRAKRLAKLYLITIVLGILCWLFDRLFCVDVSSWYFNPQGHALWHVFMGFNSYFANTFLMFCRAQQLEWNPQVVHVVGIFPYVKIQKPKTQ